MRLLGERKAELVPLPEIERRIKDLELEVKTAGNAYEIVDKEAHEAEIKYIYATPGSASSQQRAHRSCRPAQLV